MDLWLETTWAARYDTDAYDVSSLFIHSGFVFDSYCDKGNGVEDRGENA